MIAPTANSADCAHVDRNLPIPSIRTSAGAPCASRRSSESRLSAQNTAHILIVGCGAIGGLFASALAAVAKVTVFLADVKTEKNAMNEVYGKFFPEDAPARSAFGVQFPDTATRVEIELVAWIP